VIEQLLQNFDERKIGGRGGAPIVKDKLFSLGIFETLTNTSPAATTWFWVL
jgi:hypothetical protein